MPRPSLRNLSRLAILALLLAGGLVTVAGVVRAASDENSRLILQVLRDETKKPVGSAHVVVRFVSGKKFFIKDKHTSWEAQTDRKGEVVLDDIPKGHIKVQVIAKGFQTFGDEYDLAKPEENLTILLKPPAKQVSAY
jgi:hypothetical protein